jgi:integrase
MAVQTAETAAKPRKPKRQGDMPWHDVKKLTRAGTYCVADLLYVVVYVRPGATPEDKPTIKRYWAIKFRWHGKTREMGLGPFEAMSYADAKVAVAKVRQQLAAGTDPIAAKRKEKMPTFKTVATEYITAHCGEIGAKHNKDWTRSFEIHIYDSFGDVPIDHVTLNDHTLPALKPVFATLKGIRPQVIRGRVAAVWDAAEARGLVIGKNPARWTGGLEHWLANAAPASDDDDYDEDEAHHAALPYEQHPAFMCELRAADSMADRAMELCILTAMREATIVEMTWAQLDLEVGAWTAPAKVMKGRKGKRKPFTVPLTPRMVAILRSLPKGKPTDKVFGVSGWTMLEALRKFGRVDENGQPVTIHGFRATFSTWAHNETAHDHIIIEAALQHRIPDKVIRAYARGSFMGKRTTLIFDWSAFCGG